MTSYYNNIYRKEYLIVHPLKFLYGMSRFTGITFLCLLLFATILWSCTKPTEPDKNVLTFTVEDASCIEAWLSFNRNGITGEVKISLYRNVGNHPDGNTLTAQFNLPENDTVYVDEGLLPNKIYNYEAVFTQGNITIAKLKATAQTMDTTSSNFAWQTFTFGEHSSSVLYDVAIISPENIWCVGEIYMNDSSGNLIRYNAVNWNGTEWELKRIRYYGQCSAVEYPSLKAIWAFSENNIVVTNGGSIGWFDGTTISLDCGINPILTGAINKLWGTSNSNLYAVGSNGNIAHYNGSSWRKIESGTDLNLLDINGNKNGEIYSCGGNFNTGQGIILKINNNNAVTKIIDSYYYGTGFDSTKMFTENLYGPLAGIWVAENGAVYTVGNLIYSYNMGLWNYAKGIEYNYLGAGFFSGRGFSFRIKGKANNDFIFVGQRNTIRHINGVNATQLGEPFRYDSEYHWSGIDYKQNIAVAVGRNGGFAALMVFKK